MNELICEICEEKFSPLNGKWGNPKYCSKPCYKKSRLKNQVKRYELNRSQSKCQCGNETFLQYKRCQKCIESKGRYHRKLAEAGLCPRCGRKPKPESKFCKICLEASNKRHEEWRNGVYKQILEAYGGKCACCGENNPGFLTLDHKNNDGAVQRKKDGSGGYLFYLKVIKRGFPKDLQLLCFNCNCGKWRFGACPHTPEGRAAVEKRYGCIQEVAHE